MTQQGSETSEEYEDWANHHEPFCEIAEAVGCRPVDVALAFEELDNPETAARLETAAFASAADIYQKASDHLLKAVKKMKGLSDVELGTLKISSEISIDAIEATGRELAAIAEHRRQWSVRNGPRSRKDYGAYLAAEGVARLFEALQRPITYAKVSSGSNDPSTEFGRAVVVAIRAFRIFSKAPGSHVFASVKAGGRARIVEDEAKFADWSGPAEEARNRRRNTNSGRKT